jgi:uncharacterized Zn-binding protein involved in type VI secretion
MPPVARKTDTISHGALVTGSITGGASATFLNSLAVARKGDSAVCSLHPGPQTITSGLSTELVEGQQIARVNDSISCGATISSGSPNENAG